MLAFTLRRFVPAVVCVCLVAPRASAQLEVPRDSFEFGPEITGHGVRMNYGPFLAYSLISADRERTATKKDPGLLHRGMLRTPQPPIFLRAINVYLGGKHAAAFDTETCSFAAAWSGGFLNLRDTNLNGYKGSDLAYLRLPAVFQNNITPGWSLTGDWKDPRPVPIGALPKEIVHYKGLYLHGWKTILSYTVGDANVLELPSMLVKDGAVVFCRTIHIDRVPAPRLALAAELADAVAEAESSRGSEPVVSLVRDGTAIRATTSGLPREAKLDARDGRLFVRLPEHKGPLTFRLFVTSSTTAAGLAEIAKLAGPTDDLPWLCKSGPARWKETLVTQGRRGPDDAYTVDSIALPDDNPWKSWMRPGALDFFPDGRAALCTWNGDVWLVSGLDDGLQKVTWKRYATGIFEALGIKIVDGTVYVLGRDQITRLHDLNGDGEADWYENFNNDGPTAPSFHSFAIELETDRAGNFYYTRGAHRVQPGTPMHGGVIKVSKDGKRAELICTGFREPNGMAVGPDDLITVADNQGNWVPSSKIDVVRPGGYYGYVWGPEQRLPEKPLCWIPMKEDNSSGSQAWVRSDRFGPLGGQLLHTSYGTCKLFHVLMQRDGERFQGAVVPLPLAFDSGIMRARVNPRDGQLYAVGLKGWGTSAKADGGFYRVRYTGKPYYQPTALRVEKGRLALTFDVPLDPRSLDTKRVLVEQWNYRWTEKYGSPDYSVANPKKEGRDAVGIKSLSLTEDRRTLLIELPKLRPVMQVGVYLNGLRAADGHAVRADVYGTINYVPEEVRGATSPP